MRTGTVLLVCGLLLNVVGCKKLLRAAADDDDAADATVKGSPPPALTATASAAPAAPTFANAADITRYPDEKPFAAEKASVHTNMLARVSVCTDAFSAAK